jgi:hypothetical protein
MVPFLLPAKVVELADTSDLGSDAARRGGSSPPFRTKGDCNERGFVIKRNTNTGRIARACLICVLLGLLAACRTIPNPRVPELTRMRVVDLTLRLVDAPYRFGGTDIDGFDCSGFVWYVFSSYGVDVPRSAREQAGMKRKIRLDDARPGDVFAFRLGRRWHTALYVGDDRFVHAPSRNGRVRLETLNDYWRRHLTAVIDRLG